jgi:deoxyribonuclease-4
MRIGSHMSTSGGVDKAFARGEALGLEVMQIFTKNQNQWKAKPIPPEVVERYFKERERTGIGAVFAHGSYLINLCAADKETLKRSRKALLDEFERCDLLDIPYLVAHPGSHLGKGESQGLAAIAESINIVFASHPKGKVMLLLENTAGQGTNLGYRFEHLAEIRSKVENQERVGVCFDTCHAFAAGYDLSNEAACKKVFADLDRQVGIERLKVFHINDSKKPLGSRVDRHDHIGKGQMGLAVFRYLMRSRKFARHPMALETPKSEDYHEDLENIAQLKALLKD